MKLFFILTLLFSTHSAQASCKAQLLRIVAAAEDIILDSDLDPRCKALGLKGGKQNCIKATQGTIWDLKALMEPVLNRARNHCKQNVCSTQRQLCTSLLKNETHIVSVGLYGLLDDINEAAW